MKRTGIVGLTLVLLLSFFSGLVIADDTSVLFVGKTDSPRNTEFGDLLKKHFNKVTLKGYPDFTFEDAEKHDVLILDFKWGYKGIPKALPENWSKPTILIASGDMITGQTAALKINWL